MNGLNFPNISSSLDTITTKLPYNGEEINIGDIINVLPDDKILKLDDDFYNYGFTEHHRLKGLDYDLEKTRIKISGAAYDICYPDPNSNIRVIVNIDTVSTSGSKYNNELSVTLLKIENNSPVVLDILEILSNYKDSGVYYVGISEISTTKIAITDGYYIYFINIGEDNTLSVNTSIQSPITFYNNRPFFIIDGKYFFVADADITNRKTVSGTVYKLNDTYTGYSYYTFNALTNASYNLISPCKYYYSGNYVYLIANEDTSYDIPSSYIHRLTISDTTVTSNVLKKYYTSFIDLPTKGYFRKDVSDKYIFVKYTQSKIMKYGILDLNNYALLDIPLESESLSSFVINSSSMRYENNSAISLTALCTNTESINQNRKIYFRRNNNGTFTSNSNYENLKIESKCFIGPYISLSLSYTREDLYINDLYYTHSGGYICSFVDKGEYKYEPFGIVKSISDNEIEVVIQGEAYTNIEKAIGTIIPNFGKYIGKNKVLIGLK